MMEDIYHIFFSTGPKMKKIKAIVNEIAKTDITVLIKGESGTGKSLVAQLIHLNSHRHEKPFIKVNCATIPMALLESELFGFEKGAFTGAYLTKPGKFELANGGSILLNEIGELDISIQAKLLQVLQDGVFARLGGDGDVVVDTRVITTTKNHLEKLMMEGRFRQDLFFRINVISITVPPLREQREQILPLSQYFFNFYKTKYARAVSPLSSKMLNLFEKYYWPGNIRELENMIKRIVIFEGEEKVLQDLIGGEGYDEKKPEAFENISSNLLNKSNTFYLKEVGKRAAEAAEKEIIQNTLQETHWNRKEAAKLLHVSYKALLYKIEKYRLDEWKATQKVQEGHSDKLGG